MFIRKQEGFTLIELLIVVIIIGILAALAIPRFLVSQEQANINTCHANAAMISDAAERYYFQNNSYPTNLNQLVPTYLKSVPNCPKGGTYTINSNGNAICNLHGSSTGSSS